MAAPAATSRIGATAVARPTMRRSPVSSLRPTTPPFQPRYSTKPRNTPRARRDPPRRSARCSAVERLGARFRRGVCERMGVLRERRADRREPAARCAGRDVALAIDRGFLRLAAVPSFTVAAALRGLRSACAAGARDRGTRHDCPRRVARAGRGGVFAEPVVADRRGGAGDRVRPWGDLHRRPVQRRAASGDGGRVGPVGGAFERCGLRRDHGSAPDLAPKGRRHGLLHRRLGLARLPRRRVHERRRGGPRPSRGGLDRWRAHGLEPARGLDGERRPGRSERERLRRRPLRPDRWSHAQPRGRDHARPARSRHGHRGWGS